jgi:butyryl-CoA dehydrogenase
MAEKFISERNLKFLLYEVFDTPSLTQYSYYADHSRESFDMALETAMKIGKNLMKPKLS